MFARVIVSEVGQLYELHAAKVPGKIPARGKTSRSKLFTSRIIVLSRLVLTVARDDKDADLDGWVTVVNNSGTPSATPASRLWPVN